jgi:penicillin-binding protein 1A
MQVARNVYLSTEKTYTRKIYEILLTFKLEHLLTKDQILEIYMNQIFLGNRAYGFASAAETYFGKSLKDISIAEAAMLAGLPKAPSAYNPISNPKRARSRQLYIIERMEENGFITSKQALEAKAEPLKIRQNTDKNRIHAEYVAETVRQLMFSQYGQETYTRGLNVYTTLQSAEQNAAYQALRQGIMDYERRQHYRGPEKFITLPTNPSELEDAIDDALIEQGDKGDLLAAVVIAPTPQHLGTHVEVAGHHPRRTSRDALQGGDKKAIELGLRRGVGRRGVPREEGFIGVALLLLVLESLTSTRRKDVPS